MVLDRRDGTTTSVKRKQVKILYQDLDNLQERNYELEHALEDLKAVREYQESYNNRLHKRIGDLEHALAFEQHTNVEGAELDWAFDFVDLE